ncbi:tRNAIle-lysidine synthase TilS/MesJ [Indivirus ILV1]|uniref:tRNA(Ile)-lysidine synthetase n=1 Tax=Indivirus ILV1 TaxID=1977633 RepID=A0A1V0SD04_9VIRU|nr:tRNAIle-lysidine synthase TilS/MesJ [Indivirus ILV1]
MAQETLYKFWFSHENLWFNATPNDDAIITKKFKHLLKTPPNDILEKIILYDQFVRHFYRTKQYKVQQYLPIALKLSLDLIDNNLDLKYNPQEKCFILLPLRHTFELKYVSLAFEKIKEYRHQEDSKYYIRFYKATILSLSKIKTHFIIPEEINNEITNEEIFKTLDNDCIKNLSQIIPFNEKSHPIYKAFDTTIRKIKDLKEITLSLSGGVDSMVSSFILYNLSHQQKKFKIIAISINYNNREDNKYEMEFIKRWCKLLNITHYIRHITELHRDRSHDRDLYEKITKKIRFDMYKKFGNPIILGHNQDDCIENIFNNIKKTRSYNNLKGMTEFTEEDDCVLVRPMLDIQKKEIKEFAKKYHIPHLPNSTPSWSERGRIREELVPFLNNFDSSLIPGFLNLATNTSEIYTIYDKSVTNKFFESIDFLNNDVKIQLNENASEKRYGFSFWKDILVKIFKKINLRLPTNKSINAFSDRIKKNNYGLINFSKEIAFNYTKNNLILVYTKNL